MRDEHDRNFRTDEQQADVSMFALWAPGRSAYGSDEQANVGGWLGASRRAWGDWVPVDKRE